MDLLKNAMQGDMTNFEKHTSLLRNTTRNEKIKLKTLKNKQLRTDQTQKGLAVST
jgi:hypothetical protein